MDRDCQRGDGLSYWDDTISNAKGMEEGPPPCCPTRLPGNRGGDAVYQCRVKPLCTGRVEG